MPRPHAIGITWAAGHMVRVPNKKILEGARRFWKISVHEKVHQVLLGLTRFYDISEDFASF